MTVARLVNHVGLTVSDVEASAAFYADVVGLDVVRRAPKPSGGAFFDTLTGATGAVIQVIVMGADGFALQLVQYLEGGVAQAMTGHTRVGNLHLCFNVDDLDARHAAITASGRWSPTPIVEPAPDTRSFYVKDPDGVPVEFLEGLYAAETTNPD